MLDPMTVRYNIDEKHLYQGSRSAHGFLACILIWRVYLFANRCDVSLPAGMSNLDFAIDINQSIRASTSDDHSTIFQFLSVRYCIDALRSMIENVQSHLASRTLEINLRTLFDVSHTRLADISLSIKR